MKKTTAFLVAIILCAICSTVYALYSVADKGMWPESWPNELESLRKQSKTYVGPTIEQSHYAIPFTKREEFESSWPHLLKVKSKGTPIILVHRSQMTDFFGVKLAGVLIHSPPAGSKQAEAPISGITDAGARTRWMNTTYIELVVDGEVVDLNRIQLPADTPIIDERFKETEDKNGAEKKK